MATRAASLAFFCALLLALCAVEAAVEGSSNRPYPCDAFLSVDIPGDGTCEWRYCSRLCVEHFRGKYPHVVDAIGMCQADDPHKCWCRFLCR